MKQLIKRFYVKEEGKEQELEDLTKDLVDNRYSFAYRKMFANYLMKFAFYD